jgi:hypothetical protein
MATPGQNAKRPSNECQMGDFGAGIDWPSWPKPETDSKTGYQYATFGSKNQTEWSQPARG